jgi:alpha-ketoglutarate-dependent taurine dioxygenase
MTVGRMRVEGVEGLPFVLIVRGVPAIGAFTEEEFAQVQRWVMDEGRLVHFKGMTNRDDGADELEFYERFPHSNAFGNYKGTPGRLGNVDEYGAKLEIVNKLGREWHCDGAQNLMPNVCSCLSCAFPAAKAGGSATLFCDTFLGYELLSPEDRAFADAAGVRYSTKYVTGGGSDADFTEGLRTRADGCGIELGTEVSSDCDFSQTEAGKRAKLLRNHDSLHGYAWVSNPLVRERETARGKRRALWQSVTEMEVLEALDGSWTLDHAASVRRVAALLAPGTAPEHVYTLRWERGDLAVWHNVGVCHSTEHYDYENEQRYMHNLNRKGPPYQPGAWSRVGPLVYTREIEEDPDAYKRMIAERRASL